VISCRSCHRRCGHVPTSDSGLDRAAVSDDCAGRSGASIRDPRSRHDLLGRGRSHARGDGSGSSRDAGLRSTSQHICERLIGTIRRECLDSVIPMAEGHLRAISDSGQERVVEPAAAFHSMRLQASFEGTRAMGVPAPHNLDRIDRALAHTPFESIKASERSSEVQHVGQALMVPHIGIVAPRTREPPLVRGRR
jgi:hypothetical protein